MQSSDLSEMGILALKIAAKGITVFPFDPITKKPYAGFTEWPKRATTDSQIIRDWWILRPEAMVATPTFVNGFWVLDVDAGADKEGLESLKALEDLYGPLPATQVVRTPSGGLHFYFRVPDSGEIRNSASLIGKHIDVRGLGGCVVAPGSIRPQGKYEIISEWRK